jgi:hypothetical protein
MQMHFIRIMRPSCRHSPWTVALLRLPDILAWPWQGAGSCKCSRLGELLASLQV